MNRNYWVAATDVLLEGYAGILTSELVPGCSGVVLRHNAEDHTVDMAWLGSKQRDEIEHRVPVDTLVFDVQNTGAADHVSRKVASKISGKHGSGFSGVMHEMEPVGPAHVVCLPHRHGGAAARLDFVCKGCFGSPQYDGHSFIHQEYLLLYSGGKYVGADQISKLKAKDRTRLPDGSRRVDRRALAILARVMFDAALRDRP